MLIKKLGTVSLLAASIMLLDGCNILSDLFGSKKEEPVVVQPEKPATPPKEQANKYLSFLLRLSIGNINLFY